MPGLQEDAADDAENQRDVRAAFEAAKFDFKKIPEIEWWKDQFSAEHAQGRARTKFLVLEGPAFMGKTMFARHLFESENTCVIKCAGVQQPCLAGYDVGKHKAIVLDDASAELVCQYRDLLQAGPHVGFVNQNATQRKAPRMCLYNVPIIICSNNWSSATVSMDANFSAWIKENCFHYLVKELLYQEPVEEQS